MAYLFNIIKHRGDPTHAVTLSGHKVERQDKVWVPEAAQLNLPQWLTCAPYDNHFIYLEPSRKKNMWFAMCTCGAPAVIIAPGVLVCYMHAGTGRHVNAA